MTNFLKAEEIFKDLPEEIKSQIFAKAEGRLVYFPKSKEKSRDIDNEQVIIDYLKGKTYKEIAKELGTNVMRICRAIKDERRKISEKRIDFWHNQKGFSFRILEDRLYKKSYEFLRQISAGNQKGD